MRPRISIRGLVRPSVGPSDKGRREERRGGAGREDEGAPWRKERRESEKFKN